VDLGLTNSRALVTAASKGLGLACATALAAEGARVFIVSRDEARLAEAERASGAVGHMALDLARPDGPERAVEAAAALLGGLDILVCNAGGPPPGTFDSTSLELWEFGYQLTLMSAVRLARTALPHLKESGRGRIVNITSISVRQPIPNLVLSNALRAGVTAMAKTLATEVAAAGVTVNNLAPGLILTDRMRQIYPDIGSAVRDIPCGRAGDPAEFGAACAYICSRQAAYITGQTLGIDGGALRGVH
jgi:3-oxoacyl-[acyl-carrier protein] reductase